MEQCSRCKEFMFRPFDGTPVCGCKEFKVIDENGEDFEVWSIDARSAALKFAEKSNVEGDFYLMNESVDIEVNGELFSISAEPDVYYSASPKQPIKEQA